MKNIFFIVIFSLLFAGCVGSTTNGGLVKADRIQFLVIGDKDINEGAKLAYDKTIAEAKQQRHLNSNSKQYQRVKNITNRLIKQVGVFREDALDWDWEINVIDSPEINAWCMPGGKIAVYTGIINKLKLTDAELAAVIGHEIGHALREHSRERASMDMVKKIGLFAFNAISKSDEKTNLAKIVTQYAVTLPFSRSHETEADHIGTELMARAGYDPKAAVEIWKKMQKASKDSTLELLSTHPSHESRIKDLEKISKQVEKLYKK